ncbi:hypothetical protein M3Y99_00357100 [Aphelenchoides fujianensis]|nr:hypothetical protein M3Y99_00357100 [Aphelenchoides fujianensis]
MRRPRGSSIGLLLLVLLLPHTHHAEAAESVEQEDSGRAGDASKETLATVDSGELDVNAALDLENARQGESTDDLRHLYAQLEEFDCNRTIDTPLLRHLLNRSARCP